MVSKKVIGVIILLILIVISGGYLYINYFGGHLLPQSNNVNATNTSTVNTSTNPTNVTNITNITNTTNTTDLNDTFNLTNDTNNSNIDPGDIVHRQVFTVTQDEQGQNEGMEPGTYVLYYTDNDGPLKVDKIA